MAWKKVKSYSFGFDAVGRKFWMYYTLEGAGGATQVFLTAAQVTALATMFNAAASIQYEDAGKYFSSEPRQLP